MPILLNWIRIMRSILSKKYIQSDLHYILKTARSESGLADRLEWLDSLLVWIRLPVTPDRKKNEESIELARIRFLLQFLERHEELQRNVSLTLQSIIHDSDFTDFFTEAGIQVHYSFTKELIERILSSILPQYRDLASFKQTFERVVQDDSDLDWLKNLDKKSLTDLARLFTANETFRNEIHHRFRKSLLSAIKILAMRMTSLSLEADLKARLPGRNPITSPFFEIHKEITQIENSLDLHLASTNISRYVQSCKTQVSSIYPLLETSGVSIDLVYKLDTLKILLTRIELINKILVHINEQPLSADDVIGILFDIGIQNIEKSSLSSFIGSNINLIARKLVEHTGQTGEHYIARTSKENRTIFLSAAGGGFITIFTTVLKSAISKMSIPMFIEGLFSSLNYAFSFIIIQFSHFTLATKTPAMTASTLASQLKQISTPEDEIKFVEEVVRIVRTAFTAVMGNLALVIPGSIVFDLIYLQMTGQHLFSNEYGLEQIRKHSPFLSLTLVYAVVTGFILWLASIIGPWVENWFVYRKYFEMLEESANAQRYLGQNLLNFLANFFRKNLAGLGTNISLGFLLGFSGIFGTFFGLPLQVRHVTLSAGTLALSLSGIDKLQDNFLLFFSVIFSIFTIGLFNFGISFSLSLFVAARARNIRLREFPHLIVLIWRRFLRRPKDFFFGQNNLH